MALVRSPMWMYLQRTGNLTSGPASQTTEVSGQDVGSAGWDHCSVSLVILILSPQDTCGSQLLRCSNPSLHT